MPKASELDSKGRAMLDLERLIEEQRNHIVVLENVIDRYIKDIKEMESNLEQAQKQIQYLQQQIRNYGKKDISKG